MHDTYSTCLARVLVYEGGYCDDPRDPGGATLDGVTQATYAAWRASRGERGRPVRLMGGDERDAIYAARYWAPIGAEQLPAGLDLAAFDYAVNSGVGRARAALAAADRGRGAADTIERLCDRRLSFLRSLRTWGAFGRGWGARVADVRARALRLSGMSPADLRARAARERSAAGTKRGLSATTTAAPVVAAGAGGWWLAVALGLAALVALGLAWRARRHDQAAAAFETIAKEP